MDIGLKLPTTAQVTPVEWAVRAEDSGFHTAWWGELWGENSFVTLARAADRTSRIRLGTSIVNVFSRTPAVLAMSAYSVARASDGRMVMGVGPSTAKAIEDLHAMPFERPARRVHETVELVHRFLRGDGEPVKYEGDLFKIKDFPALDADVPIFNAALGPMNRRVTGRVCDGWMPYNVPFSSVEPMFEVVATAAEEAGRDPDDIEVVLGVNAVVSDDPDEAKDAIRGVIGHYAGSGAGYRRAIGQQFPDRVEQIAMAWRDGRRDEARGLITEEMIDEFGIAGTPEQARDRLRAVSDELSIDGIYLDIPKNVDDDTAEYTFGELAPEKL